MHGRHGRRFVGVLTSRAGQGGRRDAEKESGDGESAVPHAFYLTSNDPVSPPTELLLTRTRNVPGSTTHFIARS
jgi:hypothetical protein